MTKNSKDDGAKSDFAQDFYWRMREAVTGRLGRDAKRRAEIAERSNSRPFDKGRDPVKAGDSLAGILTAFNWDGPISEAELFTRWPQIVGDVNASSSQPEALVNGTLTVRCKSTAWSTQLKLMQGQILARLHEEFPKVEIKALKFLGPDAPSWKKGQRSIPGRGPRDTYG